MARVALSTYDNPYNPFDNFVAWYMYDQPRYDSCGKLARFYDHYYGDSHALSDAEEQEAIEDCINKILNIDVLGIYIKVKE